MFVSRRGKRFKRFFMIALWAGLCGRVGAAWNGAGVPGGTGDPNINDPANWTGGVVDDDFSTITANADLQLTADYATTKGLNFSADASLVRHITISGTNTITLNGFVPGHDTSNWISLFLPSNTTSTVKLNKGLTLNLPTASGNNASFSGKGVLINEAEVTGLGNYYSAYASGHSPRGILRNDTNSFTGRISGDAGPLSFTSIGNKGVPSAMGAGTLVSLNNFHIIFIGSRDQTTDRDFSFMNANVGVQNDSACGGLSITGNVSTTYKITGLYLSGLSAGESVVTDAIESSNLSQYYVKLTKRHSGTWRLTGHNTFRGNTNETYALWLYGGKLIADYADDVVGAGSNRVFLSGRNVRFEDTELVIRGKSGTGNSTYQDFGYAAVADSSANALTVDSNGGDGTTALLDESFYLGNSYGLMLFDIISEGHLFTSNAFPSSSGTLRTINGVLLGGSGARANLIVRDKNRIAGFAAQTETFEFVRHTNTLALTEGNATAADHVSLAADLTRTADLNFSTLAIDASANAVTLDLAGNDLQNDSNSKGRGIVVNGTNPVTVCSGTCGNYYAYIYNYGSDTLSWAVTNGTCIYVTSGPGLIDFSNPLGNDLVIGGGTTRLSADSNYTNGLIRIFGDGVLEIGADLNGGTAGDFTRWNGTGTGQISFYAGGGFSAFGADRTVNLGGAGSYYSWDSLIPEGFPFILSSPHADATLIFQNPLGMNYNRREVRVQDGSAAVDARMTGRIAGDGIAGLVKSGDGTLELTGAQTYYGGVSVIAGGLKLGADRVFAGNTNLLVIGHATLDAGTFSNGFNTLELLDDSTLALGDGSASLAFADSRDVPWTGTLTISGKLNATTLRFGTDANGLTPEQIGCLSKEGGSLYLDAQGFLRQHPRGTVFWVQ